MSQADSEIEIRELGWRNRVADMQERLKNRFDENTVEGNRDEKLYHGMRLVSSTMMLGKYSEICYCEETQEYLVIDPPSSMLRYSVQGKLIQPSYSLSATMSFTKLLWCQKAKLLIGYVPNDDVIWLMTSFCMLYQVVRNEFRINAIFYEPLTNEAVVTGPNKVTRYPLANKEAIINPWKTMSYIDSEYGALWKLECTTLVPSNTSPLRMAGSYMTTVYILSLETSKEKEDGVPTMFLARNTGATEAPITALFFQSSSQWVISGDEQGNVRGWDLDLNRTMSCPGIHRGSVQQIVLHPSICGFITRGEDSLLQIWSCNLRGKIESFSSIGEIRGIAVNESAAAFATLGQKLCCFNMHQLYTFYAALSEPATQIISTTNPMHSTRVVVRSADNTIRILTSPSGKQTNIQILPNKNLNLVSMAYSGIRDRLYTIILKTGEVLVSNSKTNPMEFKHVWVADESIITCITAYEHYEEIRGPDLGPQNPRVIYPKRVLIFVGTEDGAVINVDESSGKHEARFLAHSGPVTKLCSSTASRLVVSAGLDKCIKIWRVYPDLAAPLALAHSVYYTVPITQIVTMGSIICVASSTPNSSSILNHQLFMYDAKETVRLDHHPSKDHKKQIVDITGSEALQICATSSVDDTIRLWDNQNLPIKVLEINTCANTVSFSSLRGDIVFGAGRHLYKISYKNYLAPKYRARILLNGIPEETEEETLPENSDYRIYEDLIDREVLLHPVSSVPFGSLDMRGSNAPRLELMVQQQMCEQLERRDEDITNITRGDIKPVKFVGEKSLMNRDVWDKHIEDLLGLSNKPGTEIPKNDIWMIVEKYKSVKRFYNKPGVFKMLYGYSIEKFPEYPEGLPDSVLHPRIPLFGYLPNSVVYKIFDEGDVERPPPMPEPKPLIKYIYPAEFLAELLHGTSSTRFNSNMELSPSQLINMARITNVESEITVARTSITEDENPFVKMARQMSRSSDDNRELKKRKKHNAMTGRGGIKRRNHGKHNGTLKRKKKKEVDSIIPSTIEKIIQNKDERKLWMILSRKWTTKEADISTDDSLTIRRKGSNIFRISHAEICGTTSGAIDKVAFVKNEESAVFKSRKLSRRKVSMKRKIGNILNKKPKNKSSPKLIEEGFTSLDDLDEMSMNEIIAAKKSIKQMIKNNYGKVSKSHDDEIKNAVRKLLARFMNVPSSFSRIIKFTNVLPIDDIEIAAFLCTIFTISPHRIIRKSIMKCLKNNGLKDPKKILIQQLSIVRNTIENLRNMFTVEKFIQQMIENWMQTLKRNVALVADNIRQGDTSTSVKSFLRKEAENYQINCDSILETNIVRSKRFPEKLAISPIEGINYFCELNGAFDGRFENMDEQEVDDDNRKHKTREVIKRFGVKK